MPVDSTKPTWIEPPPQKPGGLGCFAKGCLSVVILGLVFIVLLGVGGYFFSTRSLISARPAPLPVEELAPEALSAVQQRIEEFRSLPPSPSPVATVEPGATPAPAPPEQKKQLILTVGEINGLIAANRKARGHAYVTLSGHTAIVQTSIPSNKLPGFAPGYLNGSFTITTDGPTPISALSVSKVQANGWPIPSSILSLSYRGRSILGYAVEAIAPYDVNSAEIRDGNVILQ